MVEESNGYSNGRATIRDVYALGQRLEDKLETWANRTDERLKILEAFMTRSSLIGKLVATVAGFAASSLIWVVFGVHFGAHH
ncbi:MAG: hypothetical protein ACYDCC_04875 [Actinomycetota bacterium]